MSRYGDGASRGRRISEDVEVSKRVRRYDPEDARQRRRGMAIAGTAIAGGALTHSGVKGIKRATQIVRAGRALGNNAQMKVLNDVRLRGVHVLPEHGRKLAAGTGLLAASGKAQYDSTHPRNARWK